MRAGALAGLAVIAAMITGCSAMQGALSPAASNGSPNHDPASHSPTSHGPASHGPASHGASPGGGGASGAASPGGAATGSPSAAPGAPAGAPASGAAGCTPWPAGSAGTNLDLNAASNGRTYCVVTGDTVRVELSGPGMGGWRPVEVSGGALVPVVTPLRPAVMPAFPLRTYRAVRPGTAALSASMACHPVQQPQAAPAARRATVVTAHFGGTPISPGCMGVIATFRVLIVVS
ncbi:MAG: hypothetical protein JOY82_26260 [Streptosporangiaceae bacterium]|nr:hypothetical protein [Streptosporangiaceae bacterium]MBV9857989.1 hypothetical protein [Streptosporangiaceae bacterium]